MNDVISNMEDLLKKWFTKCYQFNHNFACNDRIGWLEIHALPLHAWNEEFFKEMGKFFGSYILMDDNTRLQLRFDRARILVVYDSTKLIPPSITVNNSGSEFKVKVQLNISSAFEEVISGVRLDRKLVDDDSEYSDSEVPVWGERRETKLGSPKVDVSESECHKQKVGDDCDGCKGDEPNGLNDSRWRVLGSSLPECCNDLGKIRVDVEKLSGLCVKEGVATKIST